MEEARNEETLQAQAEDFSQEISVLKRAAVLAEEKSANAMDEAGRSLLNEQSGNGAAKVLTYRRISQEWNRRKMGFEKAAKDLEKNRREGYGNAKIECREAMALLRENGEEAELSTVKLSKRESEISLPVPRPAPISMSEKKREERQSQRKSEKKGGGTVKKIELKGKEAETAEALDKGAKRIGFRGADVYFVLNPTDVLRKAGREVSKAEGQRIVSLRKKGVLTLLANKGSSKRLCVFTNILGKEPGAIHWASALTKRDRLELLELAGEVYGDDISGFSLPGEKVPIVKKPAEKKAKQEERRQKPTKKNEGKQTEGGNGDGARVPQLSGFEWLSSVNSPGPGDLQKFLEGLPKVLEKHAEETLGSKGIGMAFYQFLEAGFKGNAGAFANDVMDKLSAIQLARKMASEQGDSHEV